MSIFVWGSNASTSPSISFEKHVLQATIDPTEKHSLTPAILVSSSVCLNRKPFSSFDTFVRETYFSYSKPSLLWFAQKKNKFMRELLFVD